MSKRLVATMLAAAATAVAALVAPAGGLAAPAMDGIEVAPVQVRAGGGGALDLRASVGPATPLEMAVGRTMAVPLSAPVGDVIVANPAVVDVLVQGPRQVYVLGRGPGATNVFFIGRDGSVVLNAEILVSADLTAAKTVLARLLPEASIELRAVGQGVVMSGTVHSAREAADAQAVVEQFLGASVADGLQATERAPAAAAAPSGEGGEAVAQAFQALAGGLSAGAPGGQARVINALRVIGDQQVLLQVKVAEVQRTTLKALSTNILADNGSFTSLPFPAGEPFVRAVTGALSAIGVDDMAFDVLERQGLIRVLAEPSLTAISGETANFLAGGLLPVPSDVDDEGNVRVTFREFGVSLSFTPVVLANNQLSLRIATEVSRVSEENALPFVIRGTGREVQIKGLSVRRADSTVTIPSGGSLMIAGMLQNDEVNSFAGTPGLMDLPIIGALFRSQEFRSQRTELVVVVQAFRVRPIEFAKGLALPTDGFVPASDLDIYLLGRLHARYGGTSRGQAVTLAGPVGYIME